MRVVIAPDSFKGTLSATSAAEAIAHGVARGSPQATVDVCPVADGGEGTIEAFARALGERAARITCQASDPLGRPVQSTWLRYEDGLRSVGVVELAQASGLMLLAPDERNPMRTSTFGTGQMILAALEGGCDDIMLGVGGSATCDAGCGAAQALGVRFIDDTGHEIPTPLTGGDMHRIQRVDATAVNVPSTASLRVACDVDNPLVGANGAAAVYGPQKGASPADVEALDAGLVHVSALQPGIDPATPGMGAAGGVGFALVGWLGATLESGIDLVLDTVGFDNRCAQADVVITGEGSFDTQSLNRKVIAGIARRVQRFGTRLVVLAGRVDAHMQETAAREMGVTRVVDLSEMFGEARAMADAATCLADAAEQVARSWRSV